MKKKFKCRAVFYINKSFVIEYCSYWVFPIFWKELRSNQFMKLPELFSKEQSEYFCKTIKDIIEIKCFNIDLFLDDFVKHKAKKNINKYKFIYWYRHGKEEKDFDYVEIEAKTESEAYLQVKDIRKWVFGIKLISINGINVEPCEK